MSRPVGAVVVFATLLLALPTLAQDATEASLAKPPALEGTSLTWCGDVPEVEADPSLFRDEPVYAGNPPTQQLRRWARQQPGFAELWIDRDNLGWVVVAFTQDADRRQADIRRLFPDLGAVAVDVEHSWRELRQAQRLLGTQVLPSLESGASGIDPVRNVVTLDVSVLTDEIVDLLERTVGDRPVCVSGLDPSWATPDGPQPMEGDGWTLVGQRQGADGPWYRTGIASDQAQLEALWAEAGMDGQPPAVDFVGNVVLWFAVPHGSSCDELRLDDVIVDQEASLVRPDIVMPGDPLACTSDLSGAYQYIVALERDRLPAAPFVIQLYGGWSGEDRLVVEDDLRAPGSVVAEDQVGPREAPPSATAVRSGGVVEPGYATSYAMDVSCGIGYLGELNGIHWVSARSELPAAWAPKVSAQDEIVLSVLLREGERPRLEARTAGLTVRYEPQRDEPLDRCEA